MDNKYPLSAKIKGHRHHLSNKWWLAVIIMVVIISPSKLFAQGPTISYTSGQTYTAGTAISPLVPVASNVGAPGYAVGTAPANPAMNTILSVAKDTKGNIFVVDQTNNVVKELPAGGGNAISLGGGFNLPMAVAVDASGNLFVADYYNNAVKEILANTGATVSIGSGFVNPYNVMVDTAGNVYVADVSATQYKKLTPTGGYYISSPLPAGLTLNQTTGTISGSATAASPETTYTVYAYNSSGIGKATITMSVTQPQAGPTISYNTPLSYSSGSPIPPIVPTTTGLTNAGYSSTPVAASNGVGGGEIDVFMIMGQSNALGKGDITQSPKSVPGNIVYFGGKVSTANDPLPGLYQTKLAYGSQWPAFGNTYTALTGRHLCFVQASQGGSSLIAAAQMGKGWWDATGQLYPFAAGQLQHAIDSLKILGYTPVVKGFLWDQGEADASAIANGVITQTAYTDTLVSLANRFRGQFGATLPFYILRSGAFHATPPDFMSWVRNAQEATLAIDSTMFIVTRNASTFNIRNLMNPDTVLNELHFSQPGYNELGVSGAQGVVLSQLTPATIQVFASPAAVADSGSVSNLPASVAADAAGDIYYSSPAGKSIVELPAGGGAPVTVGSGFSSPFGVAVDKSGNIYVADAGNNAIKEIPAGGGTPTTVLSGLNHPEGVAVDSQGDIFIADTYNNAVKEIPAGGAVATIGSGFSSPFAVAVDQNGNLYVADAGNNAIKKITLSTGVIQVIGSGFKKPTGVAIDKNGNVYIADEGNNAVKEIALNSGAAVVLSEGYSSPFGIAVDGKGNVYAPDDANNGIKEISPSGNYTLSPALPVGLSFASSTGIISGTTGGPSPATNYTVTVTNSAGSQAATFNLKITDNVALNNLVLSNNVALSPAFTPGTIIYTANAADTTSAVTVTPTTSDPNATVQVNGVTVTSGTASASIPVPLGTSVITTIVKGADGTTKTYTVNVVRTPSSNAALGALVIGNGVLTPYFVTDTASYTASINNTVTSMTITPTAADPTATITVNGVTVASGSHSQSLPLAVGANTITIVVTAQDGVTKQTYTIVATRGGDTNANLYGLLRSIGSISPTFTAATTSYTTTVANSVASMTVTPTAADSTATITVDGVAVASGTASQAIPLIIGPNTITIVVTAQDGVTTKTYTLVATRAQSSNATLLALTRSVGVISPAFTSDTTSYTTTIVNTVSSMTVTPTATDPNATITVDGVAVASGTASQSIPLTLGPNTITIVVTAADGVTTLTYTLVATRAQSSNANLYGLLRSSGAISPAFTADTTSYTGSVTNVISSMTVTPTAADPNATITVDGVAVASGTASQSIPLNVGPNTITIVVTAADGVTTQTYTLVVTRAGSSNATLISLLRSNGAISPAFNADSTNYTSSVAGSISSMTVTPTASDPNATITVNGTTVASGTASAPIPLIVGANTITIVVTASDGATTQTYTLVVTRASAGGGGGLNSGGYTRFPFLPPGLTIAQLATNDIVVHQGVSPNGDGINDFLQIDNINLYPDNKLTIMNRNGQLIYEANGYDNSSKVFDGHSNKNGQMQLPGTYFYQLDYTVNGIIKHKTGFLVLKY